ncbi:hypothetical protein O3G_MSEX015375, partial [Manduca sexta]
MLLVILLVASAKGLKILSAPSPLPTPTGVPTGAFNYHERVGVPLAQRLLAAEVRVGRVAGGQTPYLGEHTFFAGLLITLKSDKRSTCSAVLVSNTRVLTAAACWYDGVNTARALLVALGTTRINYDGVRVNATAIAVHPNYNAFTENNIAVLTIPFVQTTDLIRPIRLASGSESFAGYTAHIIGFGRTSTESSTQSAHDALVPVLSNAMCARYFGAAVKPEHVCTAGAGALGACPGDDGGPLALKEPGDEMLIGVISFMHPFGCSSGYPSVHTRVSHHYNWISA